MLDADRAAVHLLVDGSDPTILSVANQLVQMPLSLQPATADAPQANIEVRPYYNPERRSAVNTIPGIMGIILTMTMTLFTAVAIVRERERGNLELLINTPVTSTELMLGKIIPYIVIGYIQFALILVLGGWLFDVPLRGSLADLYLTATLFIIANLALGLMISTVATTQFQSMQMTLFVMLPSILLSGFMFPFDGMPKVAQWIGEALPNTHFIRMIRGIMLRDANFSDVAADGLILVAITVFLFTAATIRFNKRLD